MTTAEVFELLIQMGLKTEWHTDLDQPFSEYWGQLLDELIEFMHWPVKP